MDKLLKTKQAIADWLHSRISYPSKHYPHSRDVVVIDEKQQHFVHIFTGIEDGTHFHQTLFHIEVTEDAKVWIHQNNTDVPVEEALAQKGILQADIIVAMYQKAEKVAA